MTRILEELWYGNVHPQEQCTDGNKQIKHLLDLMGRNRDELTATLTDNQKETLWKYEDCLNEMNSIIEREILAHAFNLGGKIMLETVSANEEENYISGRQKNNGRNKSSVSL